MTMAVITGFLNMEAASPETAGTPATANATIIRAIHGYQRRGQKRAECRFEPSCSKYGEEAFGRYSFSKASPNTAWRIARCNKWNRGPTFDPL